MKKFKNLILLGVLCLSITGCGKDKSEDKKDTSASGDVSTEASDIADDTETENDPSIDVTNMTYDEADIYLNSLPETDASYFTISTDSMPEGEATITSYTGEDTVVVIPSQIDGKNITDIEKYAFTNNKNILLVKAPDTIKNLSESSFMNCSALKFVTNLDSLESMEEYAFTMCGVKYFVFSEKFITIPSNWTSYDGTVTIKAPTNSPIAVDSQEYNDANGFEVFILETY